MRSLISYLNCGHVYKKKETVHFMVTKFSELSEKIIPLFKKYHILGEKSKDFNDFCEVAEMMKEKRHLTQDGLEKIKKIKVGMNTGRKSDFIN